jgi:Protein of unknown function (DUF2862)
MPDTLWDGLLILLIRVVMEVGQKVKVCRIRDRVPAEVVSKIKQNPVGTVSGYKMVDGSGVGVVVKFDGNFSTWFFEDEVQAV